MSKILVIGSGAMGSALANVLVDANQKNVLVYGIDKNELSDLSNGMNTKYFGSEIKFNKLDVTDDFEKGVEGVEYIVLAIPSVALDSVLTSIVNKVKNNVLIINSCKGFYPNSESFIQAGIEKKIKQNSFIRGCVSISGPSFALEVIKKSITTVCVISYDLKIAKEVKKIFNTYYFKLYLQTDVIGSEVGGIYKNILAIGSGMLYGLGYGMNTISSYLIKGVNEMRVFSAFMGGKNETIYGLTGLGDLILTATDDNSRNFTFGKKFIKSNSSETEVTLEGLRALLIVETIRKKNKLSLPIVEMLHNVIYKKRNINDEINSLWT